MGFAFRRLFNPPSPFSALEAYSTQSPQCTAFPPCFLGSLLVLVDLQICSVFRQSAVGAVRVSAFCLRAMCSFARAQFFKVLSS